MKPVISVIIRTYNRIDKLKRAIDSVFHQTLQDWELIVVDNCSDDGTEGFIKSLDNNKVRFYSINNQGIIAASRNLGINNSKGKYIAFLDDDDWWKPEKLEICLRYLSQGADIVYHDLFLVKKANQILYWSKSKTRDLSNPVFDDLLVNGWALNNSSVVVHRSLLDKIGGLAENRKLVMAEDYEVWLRISQLTEKFVRIPHTLGYYWVGGGNISKPELVLQTWSEIEKLYKHEIDKLKSLRSFYYLYYIKGRANFKLGNYHLSDNNLKTVLSKKIPITIYVKCQFMRFMISVKKIFGG